MKNWTDDLPEDVYLRLCDCRTVRGDIQILSQSKWNHIKGDATKCKEDALVSVLELLDCNNCDCGDLTRDEYEEISNSIV